MSSEEQIKYISDSLSHLKDINDHLVNSMGDLAAQNAALSHAIMIIAASIKVNGIDLREDLIEMAIKGLRERFGLNPPRDKLIRDLLFGDPLSAPIITNLTVIRGGKDGSHSEPD